MLISFAIKSERRADLICESYPVDYFRKLPEMLSTGVSKNTARYLPHDVICAMFDPIMVTQVDKPHLCSIAFSVTHLPSLPVGVW